MTIKMYENARWGHAAVRASLAETCMHRQDIWYRRPEGVCIKDLWVGVSFLWADWSSMRTGQTWRSWVWARGTPQPWPASTLLSSSTKHRRRSTNASAQTSPLNWSSWRRTRSVSPGLDVWQLVPANNPRIWPGVFALTFLFPPRWRWCTSSSSSSTTPFQPTLLATSSSWSRRWSSST